MRFVTFKIGQNTKIGITNEEVTEVIDLEGLELAMKGTASLPNTMIDALNLGDKLVDKVKALLDYHERQSNPNWVHKLDSKEIELLAPIPRPPKNVFCLGKNYLAHALEIGSAEDVPEYPMVFTKAATSVNGPFADVLSHQDITDSLDYEGEMAIVIGKKGSKISKEEAFDYVFGYTMINDISARDIQMRHKQYFLGKSLDTACPMGPFIAHKSLVKDPQNLLIESRVNGEVRQSANTNLFIFDIPTMIATISQGTTLEPGDVIATGTPAGVGMGFNPPRFLKSGDLVEVHVEGLSYLRNKIV